MELAFWGGSGPWGAVGREEQKLSLQPTLDSSFLGARLQCSLSHPPRSLCLPLTPQAHSYMKQGVIYANIHSFNSVY